MRALWCFVDGATSVACGEDSNLCIGQNVTFHCNTTHSFLEWHIPKYRIELDFSGIDINSSTESSGDFTAILTGNYGGYLSSELRFEAEIEYNNTDILCFDGFTGEEKKCTSLMAGNNKRVMYNIGMLYMTI